MPLTFTFGDTNMKYILILLLAALSAPASAQISSTGGQVYVLDGAIQSYTNPDIYVIPTLDQFTLNVSIRCVIVDASVDIQQVAEFSLICRKDDIDAFTGTGTGDTAKFLNAVLQYVKDYLEAIPDNSGITFTI